MDSAEMNRPDEEGMTPVEMLQILLREAENMPVMMDEAILIRYHMQHIILNSHWKYILTNIWPIIFYIELI